jgi:cytochrome c
MLSTSSTAEDLKTQIGVPVQANELARFFAVLPDGTGLPAGEGDAATGRQIYSVKCSHCHGQNLEGIKAMGSLALAGGRGSLASNEPLKTVESYWPYASTLYDYIWRAMPFDRPGSLMPDEVYSLTAYILSVGKIISESQVLNAQTLSRVVMPNAKGFYDGGGPELGMYEVEKLNGSSQ